MSSYRSRPRWSSKQTEFVRNHYHEFTDQQLSEMIGRSMKSIRLKRQRLELAKAHGRGVCKKAEPKSPEAIQAAKELRQGETIVAKATLNDA